VHRALLAGLGVDDAAPEPRELSDAAEWTSMREREAMAVERRADDISRAFYLKHVLEQSGWKSEAVAGKHTAVSATAAPSKDRRPAGKVVSSRGGPRPGRPDREGSREAARGGPTFKGEVTGLIGGGMFVAFGPDLTFEGMLPLRELKEHMGGYWDLNEFGTSLVDANSGHQIKLGSEVEVAVLAIEPARGRVDLLPVNV
jgi:ribonuclease R